MDALQLLVSTYGVWAILLAFFGFFAGGFVKGAVGFALPPVAVSIAVMVLPAQTVIAMLIAPIFVTNLWQALEHGLRPFWATARRFLPTLIAFGLVLWISAGLLAKIDERVPLLLLGVLILLTAGTQLAGWRPRLAPRHERKVGVAVGGASGLVGGLTGLWGPPVILYLLSLGVDKAAQTRAAGLIFLLGSLVAGPAYALSGVLDGETAALSLAAVPPTLLGQALGQRLRDRIDLELFRRITLIVLCLSALNLLRRALI